MIFSVIFSLFSPGVVFGVPLGDLESRAMQLLQSHSYGELVELSSELKSAKVAAGLQNLSAISEALLSQENCGETCDFYINLALELSPTDPVVAAMALTLKPSVALFFQTAKHLGRSPTLFAQTFIVGMFAVLLCFTLVLALATIVRVARMEVGGYLRGSLGIFGFLILAFGCLPFGILPSIASWLLLLGLCGYSIKKSAAVLVALSLGWILLLPVGETVISNLRRESERKLEILLSPVASSAVYTASQTTDPLELLAAGTILFNRGEFRVAKEAFSAAAVCPSKKELSRVAYARLGAAELALREFDSAERSLQHAMALGGGSFEIYQNLAIAETGRVNLDAQRRYLQQLRSIDEKRFRRESTELAILLEPVPLNVFWKRYLEPPERFFHSMAPVSTAYLQDTSLTMPLTAVGGVTGLLGLCLFGAGLCLFRRPV